MPPWLQQIVIAISAFAGGRIITSVGERMRESKELRRSVDKLTLAVEQVPQQLGQLQGEIHRGNARQEAQLNALRTELHDHKVEQLARFNNIEERIEATTLRVDGLARSAPPPPPPWSPEPRVHSNLRVDREGRCLRPEFGADGKDEAAGNHGGGHG